MKPLQEKDFPLYTHLEKVDPNPITPIRKQSFEEAVNGTVEQRYFFVHGIQTVAANCPVEDVPGATEEMFKVTLQSCLRVYKECAKHGHWGAAIMVREYRQRGLGR